MQIENRNAVISSLTGPSFTVRIVKVGRVQGKPYMHCAPSSGSGIRYLFNPEEIGSILFENGEKFTAQDLMKRT